MHINSINAADSTAQFQLKKGVVNYYEKPVDQPIGQDTVSFQGKMASPAKTKGALLAMLALLGGAMTLTSCQNDEESEAVVVTNDASTYGGGYITDEYTADVSALKDAPNQSIGDSIKLGESYYDENGQMQHRYKKLTIKGYVPVELARNGGKLSSTELARLGIAPNASYSILKTGDRVRKPEVNNYNFDISQNVEIYYEGLDRIAATLDSLLAEARQGNQTLNNVYLNQMQQQALMESIRALLASIDTNVAGLPNEIRVGIEMLRGIYEDWINNHWQPYTDEQQLFRVNLINTLVHYGNTNNADNATIISLLNGIYPYLDRIDNNLSIGFNSLMENDNQNTEAIIRAINNVTLHIDLSDANRTAEASDLMVAISNASNLINNTGLEILANMNSFNPELLAKLRTIIANQNTQIDNQNAMSAMQQQGFADVIAAIRAINIPGSTGNYDAKLDRIIELLFQGNGLLTQYGSSILNRFDDLIPLVRNGFISMNTHFTLVEGNQELTLDKMDDLSAQLAQMDANQQAAAAEQIWREDTIIAKLDRLNLQTGDISNFVRNLNINPQVDLTQLELLVGQLVGKMDTANAGLAELNVTAYDIRDILNAMKLKMGQIGDQAHADALAILNRIPDPVGCDCDCDEIIRILLLIAEGRYDEAEHGGGSIFN